MVFIIIINNYRWHIVVMASIPHGNCTLARLVALCICPAIATPYPASIWICAANHDFMASAKRTTLYFFCGHLLPPVFFTRGHSNAMAAMVRPTPNTKPVANNSAEFMLMLPRGH